MAETRLQCLSPESAQTVATGWDLPDQNHRARAEGSAVVLDYIDKRYPLHVADWAFGNGHAEDSAAAALIGGL